MVPRQDEGEVVNGLDLDHLVCDESLPSDLSVSLVCRNIMDKFVDRACQTDDVGEGNEALQVSFDEIKNQVLE